MTPDGHVERYAVPLGWKRELADQAIVFRVVAMFDNNVWAGGNDGALFHSSDGGENWSRIALGADGKAEGSAIVAILFDNPQQGSIKTEAGTRWDTADGGKTWAKQ